MRILVVEDDGATRTAMAMLLADVGHDVVVMADGFAGLAAIDAGPPFDVVLLDLMMPVMDGWSFFWQLSHRPGPKPRVVVLSAADEVDFPEGAAAVLRKPVDVDELLRVIAG